MADDTTRRQIEAIRAFGRFYTKRIGVLERGMLGVDLGLPEARVLFEAERREGATAAELMASLEIDPGYLSRLLRGCEKKGLIARRPCVEDGRQRRISLTAEGRRTHALLTERANAQVATMIGDLAPAQRARLVAAMTTVERLLAPSPAASTCKLRQHRPGDLGWLIHRHGVLYSREVGFDHTFEATITEMVAGFGLRHDPSRERLWIAELDGEPVGSVMLTDEGEDTARLRFFLVEPAARGHGVGTRLVDQLLRFARARGYRRIGLATISQLETARRLYRRYGFHLAEQKAATLWGREVVDESWLLDLSEAPDATS